MATLRGALTAPTTPMVVPVATNPSAKINQFRVPVAPAMKNVRATSPSEVMNSAPVVHAAPAMRDFGNIATARAISDIGDPGSPFSAFAKGWINAGAERDILEAEAAEKMAAEAEAKAIRETTAEMLAGHPDLQRLVQINGLKPDQALERKEQREQAAAALNQETEEKAQIMGYLEENHPEFVEPFAAGLWDTQVLAENISKKYETTETDYGDPGKGRAWVRNQDGSVKTDEQGLPIAAPFQGGEAWKDPNAPELSRDNTKAEIVVQDIDRALSDIAGNPLMTTGVGAAITGGWAGSPAYNVGALIDTVKANAGFEELQAMREASPTGAALGSVTEKEIAYLQATIGNLDPKQGEPQLRDNLKRVKNAYMDIIHGPGSGPPRESLGFESPAAGDASGAAPQAAPATATNPETGEKMQWDGQKWVPVQ